MKREVSEKLLLSLTSSDWIPLAAGVSPDSKHAFYIAQTGERVFAVVDGQKGKQYEGIIQGTPTFSPDSKRFAYIAKQGPTQFVVLDGIEGKPYDGIGNTLTFSPDSTLVAYRARTGGRQFVVVNDKEGGFYDGIGGKPVFSPDSKRIAYVAGRKGGKWRAIVGGKEEKEYQAFVSLPVFSPDSKHVAYVAEAGGNQVLIVDGREMGTYDDVREFVFSPSSQRWACFAKEGGKWAAIVDGKEIGRYDAVIGAPVFSPDSTHLAFSVQSDRFKRPNSFVVIDGKESEKYDQVGSPVFSPDGLRLAFPAMSSEPIHKPTQAHGSEKGGHKEFGMEWKIEWQNRWFLVVDGHKGGLWESIETKGIRFSPDSKHVVFIANPGRGRYLVAINDSHGREYEGILENRIVFDSPTEFHYSVLKNKYIFLIQERMK